MQNKNSLKRVKLPSCLELMTDSVSVVVYSSAILLLWMGLLKRKE